MRAGLNLGLDYLFLLAYAGTLGLGCVLVSLLWPGRWTFLAPLGAAFAWSQILAALLDCVENYALISLLLGSEKKWWPALARWCAIAKFLIVAAALAYAGIGAFVGLGAKVQKNTGSIA